VYSQSVNQSVSQSVSQMLTKRHQRALNLPSFNFYLLCQSLPPKKKKKKVCVCVYKSDVRLTHPVFSVWAPEPIFVGRIILIKIHTPVTSPQKHLKISNIIFLIKTTTRRARAHTHTHKLTHKHTRAHTLTQTPTHTRARAHTHTLTHSDTNSKPMNF
jgi:hypothetical protein